MMGNEFYHEFTVGMNYWMIMAPVMVLVMIILGILSWNNAGDRRRKPYSVYGDKFLSFAAGLLAGAFGLLLHCESYAGIIQWLDNNAGATDSPAWSIFLEPLVVFVVMMMVYAVLHNIGVTTSFIRENYLRGRYYSKKNQNRKKDKKDKEDRGRNKKDDDDDNDPSPPTFRPRFGG